MIANQATNMLLLATLLAASLPISAQEYTAGRSKWGDEFCRNKFCAVISTSQQDQCCVGYKQCCAYVEMYRIADPFAYSYEVAETLPPPSPTPPPQPPFTHRIVNVGPPKSMRLREEGSPSRQPPSLSLTRDHDNNNNNNNNHHHRHRHHHQRRPSTRQPRPAIHLLDGGDDLLKTSYNDQLVRGQERYCKHSYCSLLSSSQHKLCCNIYDTCCSYANYRLILDPFHPDNGNRRR